MVLMGFCAMRHAGAMTIGQDQRDKPCLRNARVAFEVDAVEKQLPLEKIGHEIYVSQARDEEGGRACRSRQP